jgi:hypothetical protein
MTDGADDGNRLRFGLTYDYLCPFARNANEHVAVGLRGGAPWDVTFIPFSLSQAKAAESGEVRWDPAAALRRSGMLALAVAELVRVELPDHFLAVHLELFALRHDRAEDLRDPGCVADALERSGAPTTLVDRAADGIEAVHEAHTSMLAQEVWGVPTFIGARRAVFVRLLDRPGPERADTVPRIERLVRMIDDDPMLHEFKQVDLPV